MRSGDETIKQASWANLAQGEDSCVHPQVGESFRLGGTEEDASTRGVGIGVAGMGGSQWVGGWISLVSSGSRICAPTTSLSLDNLLNRWIYTSKFVHLLHSMLNTGRWIYIHIDPLRIHLFIHLLRDAGDDNMMLQFGYRYHGENQFPPSEWGKCVVGGRRTPERPNKTQHTASKTSQGRPSCHQPLITRVDALRRSHWTTR